MCIYYIDHISLLSLAIFICSFFFFKQKTAYEMRISDWSSDVCSSDLARKHGVSQADVYQLMAYARIYESGNLMLLYPEAPGQICGLRKDFGIAQGTERLRIATIDIRSEEHTSELQSLMRISYAVFCLKKKR